MPSLSPIAEIEPFAATSTATTGMVATSTTGTTGTQDALAGESLGALGAPPPAPLPPETLSRAREAARRVVAGRQALAPAEPTGTEQMPEASVAELIRASERLVVEGVTDSAGTFMRYLHDLRRYNLLKPDQEYKLARLAQAGNREARDALVRHNLRFVITLAKKYASSNVLFEDLVQEGNLGLMRAVTKFDPDRGVKLVSYAAYWIEQAIRSALVNQQRAVRLPANRAAELSKVKRAVAALRTKNDRTPAPAEVAAETGLPVATVQMLLDIGGDVPLDAPVREDSGEGTWTDRLVAEGATDEHIETESRSLAISQLLGGLKPRDATVLRLCFGLNYHRDHTLEEVGLILGISRERARQIRDRALREIASSPDLQLLSDFWDTRRRGTPKAPEEPSVVRLGGDEMLEEEEESSPW